MKKFIAIVSFMLVSFSGFTQEVEGTWYGNIEVEAGRTKLLVFQITKTVGKLETEMAIPGQGIKGIKPALTTFEEGTLLIDASNLGFKYIGTWQAASATIKGSFQEGAKSIPLVLTKETIVEVKLNRPQEPIKPYPYHEEEVKFHNKIDNVTLAGTLTLPKPSGKKPPVVVLISGSGPQDRDQSFASHKTFMVLSDHLTRNGIAVLRYDDRGFGESTGNFADGTTADFATDVLSAIDYLKQRKDIDIRNIGLIGHSEGAIIAPMVANKSKDLAFIVMLAGTGTTGKVVSLTQALDSRNFPVPDEKQYEAYVRNAIEIASSNKETAMVRKELSSYYQNSEFLNATLPSTVNKSEFIANLVAGRTSPWVRYFYNYNPINEISKINIPALALYGSNDTQVPPKYHLEPVKEALEASRSKKYEVVLLKGLNHLFQESNTGLTSEYSQIEQTFAPQALENISAWILKQTK